jgi:hypothetical protein
VDRIRQRRDDEDVLVLRDPLGVAEPVAVAAKYAPVLDLLDGTRTPAQVRQSLIMGGGVDVHADDLQAFVHDLAAGGWLDDAGFRERWEGLHAAFIAANPRPARFAGVLYPDDPATLRTRLADHFADVERTRAGSDVRGVLVPHGPPELVGSVMDRTLTDLPPANELELVVILGTDHGPGLTPYVATRKAFATPLGVVANATETFDALRRRVPWIDREEIRHRDAVSIELAVVYLQHVYGDGCPPILPVLCGQTVLRGRTDGHAARFVAALEALTEDRPVLYWGSAELHHAGEAYGRPAVDAAVAADLAARDEACLADLAAVRVDALASRCREPHPQGRMSGGAVMTTLASVVGDKQRAEVTAHETKTIPGSASTVGLAGVRFQARRAVGTLRSR